MPLNWSSNYDRIESGKIELDSMGPHALEIKTEIKDIGLGRNYRYFNPLIEKLIQQLLVDVDKAQKRISILHNICDFLTEVIEIEDKL